MGFLLDDEDVDVLRGKQKIKQNKTPAKKAEVPKKQEIKIDYNHIIPEDEGAAGGCVRGPERPAIP